VNDLWKGPYSGGGGGYSCKQLVDTPVPNRVRNSEGPPHRRRGWSCVLAAAQGLNYACLASSSEARNGEELRSRLRKGLADVYGRVSERDKYVPFISKLVKELPRGAQPVDGLHFIPEKVARVFADETACVKTLRKIEKRWPS
jgi:hypothetical protein